MPVQFCTICTGKIGLEKRAGKGFEKSSEISSAFVWQNAFKFFMAYTFYSGVSSKIKLSP